MPAKPKKPAPLLWVDIREAKPNPIFTEAQRASMRFLIFSRPVPCAACGKKAGSKWTMLCEFNAAFDMDEHPPQFTLQFYPQTFPPLTPVCVGHCLRIAWPENSKTPKPKTAKLSREVPQSQ